jgi:hypothetical protein
MVSHRLEGGCLWQVLAVAKEKKNCSSELVIGAGGGGVDKARIRSGNGVLKTRKGTRKAVSVGKAPRRRSMGQWSFGVAKKDGQ